MSAPRITAFTDCASQDIVIRVPYELAIQLVANAPDSDDKQELIYRMHIASQRSPVFKKMLVDWNGETNDSDQTDVEIITDIGELNEDDE